MHDTTTTCQQQIIELAMYDNRLSLAAKGMLSLVANIGGRPTISRLVSRTSSDRNEVISAMIELEDAGYITWSLAAVQITAPQVYNEQRDTPGGEPGEEGSSSA